MHVQFFFFRVLNIIFQIYITLHAYEEKLNPSDDLKNEIDVTP